MILALVLLTILALIAAIGAIYHVQDQRNIMLQLDVQDVMAPAAEKPQLQPDLDSEQPIPASVTEIQEASPTTEIPQSQMDLDAMSSASSSPSTSEPSLIVPPFAAQPEPEIPLAASLGVTDVLNPQIIDSPHLDLDHSDLPQVEEQDSPSVLEEVTQLGSGDELLNRLARQIEDPDSTVRVAVAAALGEIAVQGYYRDRAISLLNQLSQDVDPIVRTQAATSLGSIPLDIA